MLSAPHSKIMSMKQKIHSFIILLILKIEEEMFYNVFTLLNRNFTKTVFAIQSLLFVFCIAFKSYIIPVFTDCKYGFSSDSQSTKELAKFELQS